MIKRSKENETFHDNAEKVFNKLPLSITEKSNYKIFCSMTKKFFNDKGLTRVMLSMNNCNVPTLYHSSYFLFCVLLKLLFFTDVDDT